MRVLNVHERELAASPAAVGRLLDRLASEDDVLWPYPEWPRMSMDRPLEVGAVGGHGPIRYRVDEYARGTRVVFRFTAPAGFIGTHRFEVAVGAAGSHLRHVLEMEAKGVARLSWPLLFRHLHDALIEDCLDRAQRALGEGPPRPNRWSGYVRFLRRALRRPRRPLNVYLLVTSLLFQGSSGLAGGFGLIADPSGGAVGLPASWLEGSPFGDYLVPGIILLAVLGVIPLIVGWGVWTRRWWSWFGALFVGAALVSWIAVQILVVGYHPDPPLQVVYGAVGVLIFALALLPAVRRYTGKTPSGGAER